ncbi:cupin domain-containing protein [uncultured Roseobacter sp.]|uniref:(R)-mandelonitrile lyase n=1 Tax=uncultured Roseobacter sp. TaxID=114847 RepID=UPI00262C102E|nr:cupin domain-containing protein [uncultured Roseobacter sp.]
MDVTRAGSKPSETGPADYFTGAVRMDPVISAPEPARLRAVMVTFEPGARTAWHTHPLGQTLIVTSGVGRAQTEGQPVQTLRPGDVVWIPPGEKHWHGSAADTGMSHLAMQEAQNGVAAVWMEQVSEADYMQVAEDG